MVQFLLGLLGGVVLSLFFSFGPAFFSQIQASIHYGFRNAMPFAIGVSMSDILIVALFLFLSRNIPIEEIVVLLNNRWIICIGAAVVASFGLYTMFVKTKRTAEVGEYERLSQNPMPPARKSVFFRGLFLNLLNPLIWLYWSTLVTLLVCGDAEISVVGRYLFFGGVLTATLGMDILKCKLASMLQRIITFRFLKIFNKTVGCILIAFAVVMVASSFPRFERENSQRPAQMMQEVMHTKPTTIKKQ